MRNQKSVKFRELTRHYYPLDNKLVAELDIFEGKLKGLVFAEVEFPTKKKMDSFTPPNWFGEDITQEEWSINTYLAGKSFKEIKNFLGKAASSNHRTS